MPEPFEEIADLDRVVHEPARLAILTALAACQSAEFLFLQRLTGLTKGNLSSHLSRLEAADLISIDKDFVGKTPRTRLRITAEGQRRIDNHWRQLELLRAGTKSWRPALRFGSGAPATVGVTGAGLRSD